MLPLMINVTSLPIAVIGNGFAAAQRIRVLKSSDAGAVTVYAPRPGQDVAALAGPGLQRRLPVVEDFQSHGFRVVYVCDLPDKETNKIMDMARDVGALVNVHDQQALCDFHMPAILRRGNLQVTVSTDGRVAGLSRILRDFLADHVLGPEWAERVNELGQLRAGWVSQGLPFEDLKKHVDSFVERRGWIPADRK